MLKINQLHKSFNNIEVLKGITTEFNNGETSLIIGQSGSGKTVLLKCLLDLYSYDKGDIYYGADDDGSGTVALMEMAQAFRNAEKEGRGPKRSILFLHLTGEEIGKRGSEYYTSHPVFPLENTLVDLNIDMIGRVDEVHKNNKNYIYLIGSDRLSKELHFISEKINQVFFKINFASTNADLSPLSISPLSSQKILRSPSPSNAS